MERWLPSLRKGDRVRALSALRVGTVVAVDTDVISVEWDRHPNVEKVLRRDVVLVPRAAQ